MQHIGSENVTAHVLTRDLRPSILAQIPNLPTFLSLEAHGHVLLNGSNQPNGRIELDIPEVEWQQHRYQKLEATASFFNGFAEIVLQSQDPSLYLNVDAKAALDKKLASLSINCQWPHQTPISCRIRIKQTMGKWTFCV